MGLILLLLWRLVRDQWKTSKPSSNPQQKENKTQKKSPRTKKKKATTQASNHTVRLWLCGLLLLPAFIFSPSIEASIPSPQMLKTLKERLLTPPNCLPSCASINRMQLVVEDDTLRIKLHVHAATHTSIPLPGSQTTWLAQLIHLNGEPAQSLLKDQQQTQWIALEKGHHVIDLMGVLAKRNSISLPLRLKPHYVLWSGEGWSIEGLRDNGVPDNQLQLTRQRVEDDADLLRIDESSAPVFVKVTRRLQLGLEWTVNTQVTRLSDRRNPVTLALPLLKGEQPLNNQFEVKNGTVEVRFKAKERQIQWSSTLKHQDTITLQAANSPHYMEVWQVDSSPIWHVHYQGIPINTLLRKRQAIPTWYPWPNETLTLTVTRPKGVKGASVTALNSHVHVRMGKRAHNVTMHLTLLASQGIRHTLTLPEQAQLDSVHINRQKQNIRLEDRTLTLALKPGKQEVKIVWQNPQGDTLQYQLPAIDLGLPSVNSRISFYPPQDRWVLWADGPRMGPAVLFWGILLVLFVLAFGLGYSKLTPLGFFSWFLLGIGLSQVNPALILVFIAWLFALGVRHTIKPQQFSAFTFNSIQIGIAGLTVLALFILFTAVSSGLLGSPDMQIMGNDSYHSELHWYQDRSSNTLPQPYFISVPMLVYRCLMLAWALWLAVALIHWLRWGWSAISQGGLWKQRTPKKVPSTNSNNAQAAPQASENVNGTDTNKAPSTTHHTNKTP